VAGLVINASHVQAIETDGGLPNPVGQKDWFYFTAPNFDCVTQFEWAEISKTEPTTVGFTQNLTMNGTDYDLNNFTASTVAFKYLAHPNAVFSGTVFFRTPVQDRSAVLTVDGTAIVQENAANLYGPLAGGNIKVCAGTIGGGL